jgi:hypothetical protein
MDRLPVATIPYVVLTTPVSHHQGVQRPAAVVDATGGFTWTICRPIYAEKLSPKREQLRPSAETVTATSCATGYKLASKGLAGLFSSSWPPP